MSDNIGGQPWSPNGFLPPSLGDPMAAWGTDPTGWAAQWGADSITLGTPLELVHYPSMPSANLLDYGRLRPSYHEEANNQSISARSAKWDIMFHGWFCERRRLPNEEDIRSFVQLTGLPAQAIWARFELYPKLVDSLGTTFGSGSGSGSTSASLSFTDSEQNSNSYGIDSSQNSSFEIPMATEEYHVGTDESRPQEDFHINNHIARFPPFFPQIQVVASNENYEESTLLSLSSTPPSQDNSPDSTPTRGVIPTPSLHSRIHRECEVKRERGCGRIRGHETQTGAYQCTLDCGRSFRSPSDLKRHEEITYVQRVWYCTVCGEHDEHIFYRKDKIRDHLRKRHQIEGLDDLKQYEISMSDMPFLRLCGFCDYAADGWDERHTHIATHFEEGATMDAWESKDNEESSDDEELEDASDHDNGFDDSDSDSDWDGDDDNMGGNPYGGQNDRGDHGGEGRQDEDKMDHMPSYPNGNNVTDYQSGQYQYQPPSSRWLTWKTEGVHMQADASSPMSLEHKTCLAGPSFVIEVKKAGKGAFGLVRKVSIYPSTQLLNLSPAVSGTDQIQYFAMKQYQSRHAASMKREVRAFSLLKEHDHIVRFLGASSNPDLKGGYFHKLLLEFADSDMGDLFANVPPPTSAEGINKHWKELRDLAGALKSIHQVPLKGQVGRIYHGLHADIKPDNILRVGNKWKLADFGFSEFLASEGDKTPSFAVAGGTAAYSPPEMFAYRSSESPIPVTQALDIWSFGCVLSLAATWVTLGPHGYRESSRLRRQAMCGLELPNPFSRPFATVDCFHDGKHLLREIQELHAHIREVCPVGGHTSLIVGLLEENILLGIPERRLLASALSDALGNILTRALLTKDSITRLCSWPVSGDLGDIQACTVSDSMFRTITPHPHMRGTSFDITRKPTAFVSLDFTSSTQVHSMGLFHPDAFSEPNTFQMPPLSFDRRSQSSQHHNIRERDTYQEWEIDSTPYSYYPNSTKSGLRNQVTAEFNLVYGWHSRCLSDTSEHTESSTCVENEWNTELRASNQKDNFWEHVEKMHRERKLTHGFQDWKLLCDHMQFNQSDLREQHHRKQIFAGQKIQAHLPLYPLLSHQLWNELDNLQRVKASETSDLFPDSQPRMDWRSRTSFGKSRDEAPITEAPCIGFQNSKVLICTQCNESGFRAFYELRRHYARKHDSTRKAVVCIDIPKVGRQRPGSYYNAAAHLRSAHFHPHQKGISISDKHVLHRLIDLHSLCSLESRLRCSQYSHHSEFPRHFDIVQGFGSSRKLEKPTPTCFEPFSPKRQNLDFILSTSNRPYESIPRASETPAALQPQKRRTISAEHLNELRDLIQQRYNLDVEIWKSQHVDEPRKPLQEKPMDQTRELWERRMQHWKLRKTENNPGDLQMSAHRTFEDSIHDHGGGTIYDIPHGLERHEMWKLFDRLSESKSPCPPDPSVSLRTNRGWT